MEFHMTEVASGVHQVRGKHVSWVLVTEGRAVTLVDSGYPGDRGRLLASLERIGRSVADVEAVVLTHGHPDHLGSAEHLRREHDVPVWAHPAEATNATGARIEQVGELTLLRHAWRPAVLRWAVDILRLRATTVERVTELSVCEDGPLDVPGAPVVVHTPGHTSGHCAVHLPGRGALLAGDALMTGHAVARGEGPRLLPDFFNTDTAQARASLATLADLEADVVVPGHGAAFRGSPRRAVDLALAASG